MTTPQDRILELALHEVVGGRRPPDLVESILARRRRTVHRLPLRWIAAAAAALLLVSVAIWAARLLREPAMEPQPPTVAQLTVEEQTQAAEWIALQRETIVVDLNRPADLQRLTAQWQASRDLLDLLDRKTAGWVWVRPRLLPLPQGADASDVRGRLIEILGRAPGAESDPLLLERIRDDSAEMDHGTLLVLAERGCAPARTLLERRVANRRPSFTLALPAAYLAVQGDGRGEASLTRFVASPKSQEAQPAVALACAAGLRRLGDPAPWTETTAGQQRFAADRLSAGDLEAARQIVAALTLVRPAVAAEETIRLGDLDRREERLARLLRSELPTADAIRARLAELVD